MEKTAWQRFFDSHCKVYDENAFTKNTSKECAFLSGIIPPDSYPDVLDVGCGTGRHSVVLSSMGYRVTGIDLSEGMLGAARKKASELGLETRFLQADATGTYPLDLGLTGSFDAAICLCEGSMGLIGTGDDPVGQPLAVIGNVGACLRKGGIFVTTVLNAARFIRRYGAEEISSGRFDPVDVVEWHPLSELYEDVEPELGSTLVGEKSFTGSEMRLMLRMCGFTVSAIWGGTAGMWGRRKPDPDEYEIMVVAVKD